MHDGTPGGAGHLKSWNVQRTLALARRAAAAGFVLAALGALVSIGYPGVRTAVAAYGYGYGYEYEYDEAHLIVIKHVVNDDSGSATASSFTMTIGGVTATGGSSFPGAESPGTDRVVTSGTYTVTETGPPGYVASFSAGCSGTIAPGETRTCTVTNNDLAPRRSPGFFKNHPAEIERLLPLQLGAYTVDTTAKAIAIIDASCKDPVACLAGKLLVAELNLAHGSDPCIAPTVSKANAFLSGGTVTAGGVTATGVSYAGPSGTYALDADGKTVARTLGDALADYNSKGNGNSCDNP